MAEKKYTKEYTEYTDEYYEYLDSMCEMIELSSDVLVRELKSIRLDPRREAEIKASARRAITTLLNYFLTGDSSLKIED